MMTKISTMILLCYGTNRHWILLDEDLMTATGFSLCSQKSRESLPILGFYPEHGARNVCPLLHLIVMRDDEIMGQILVNA